jgi:hypothetical protein
LDESETAVSPAIAKDTAVQIPPRGVVRGSSSSKKTRKSGKGAAKSGAVPPNMADLLAFLSALTPEEWSRLQVLVRGSG